MPRSTMKGTVEGALSIDVRWLARNGMLETGSGSSLSWLSGGNEIGSIKVRGEGSQVRFLYDYQGRSIDLPVTLESTSEHFGGCRAWVTCPGCSRRCVFLYTPTLNCRSCCNLAYQSERTGKRFQSIKTRRRILDRLGGADTLSPKPKGMWNRTYSRLSRKFAAAGHAFVMEGAR